MNERTNQANIAVLKPVEAELQLPAVRETGTEIAAAFSAARAKSMVEARYVMAMRQPRDWDKVRQDVLKECKRPGFARNKSVYYIKPIGDGVEGLGIRFAEAALRCMTNVLVESEMSYEDREKEVHVVTVTDLESNITYPQAVRVGKTVERQKLQDGQEVVSQRKNSWGKTVYQIVGTEDDILNKRGAAISKAIRTLALRIIPGDIQDEAEALIKSIRLNEAAQDPDAERKKIVDAFGELNVPADELNAYLGHPLATCSPAELVKLRGIYGAIRDGEATWAQVLENKVEAPKKDPPKEPPKEPEKPNAPAQTTETAQPPAAATVAPAPNGDLLGGAPAPAEPQARAPRKRRPTGSIE